MDFQLIIIIGFFAAAIAYLGFRFYKSAVKKQQRGSCPDCNVHAADRKKI